jgi:hypothetical protein
MKKVRAVVAFLVAFIYVTCLLANSHPVQAASGTLRTDQAIYPIWGIGGTVKVTAQNLETNVTYSLWLQKPKPVLFYPVSTPFVGVNGTTQAPIAIVITPDDPPGTYTLSLSKSTTFDTREAIAHFGVVGTDARSYERTKSVTIAGGGFASNSSLALDVRAGNRSVPGVPTNIAAQPNGEFSYTFKLSPSAVTGILNATLTGLTFDAHQPNMVSSFFIVRPTTISVQSLGLSAKQVERIANVNATYRLSYPDHSAVTALKATADIVISGNKLSTVPLLLVNSTTGEWQATWAPAPSANTTTVYRFQVDSATLTDAYGNTGQGPPAASTDFNVVPAKLHLTIQTHSTLQRTQTITIMISATYPNGANAANVTQANVIVTQTYGKRITLGAMANGTLVPALYAIPVNASLGNWTLSYKVQDFWGNSGSGGSTIQVQRASPTFQLQTPPTTERTTFMNVTNRMSYPDGTPMNTTATLLISHGNLTWNPALGFNSTTLVWSGSLYIVQNATLGPYNITWATRDSYGNGGNNTSTSIVIPARFRFKLPSNNSTMDALSNLDLNMTARYPNGTTLTNSFGNVTGTYTNSTGSVLTLPLAYNDTERVWHMYFSVPEEGNLTFSFSAIDRYGNMGLAAHAYNLKINPSTRVQTQRLIIAGIAGALIPIALLIWAIATISTRRRKHRP